jgi:hypothetical protein
MSEPNPPLIFSWQERDRAFWRLMGWVLFTLGTIAVVFVLFQVVYPQPRQRITYPEELLLLSADQTATRALVSRIQDRDHLLIPPEPQADTRTREAMPVFQPSFQGFSMKLRGLQQTAAPAQTPRLYSPDDLPLPPVVLPALAADATTPTTTATKKQVLRLQVHGIAAKRALLTPAIMEGVKLDEPYNVRFHLAIAPEGHVLYALPLSGPADTLEGVPVMRQLQQAVSSMRFAAATDGKPQNAEVSFRWEAAAQ